MKCEKCGVEVAASASFCHQCGAPFAAAGQATKQPETPAEQFMQAARPGQSAAPDVEQDLWSGGYSAKDMIGAWLGAAALTVVLAVGGFFVGGGPLGLILGLALAAAVWVVLLGVLAYRKLSISYRLTTQRFMHHSGILRRLTNRIEVLDMDDVSFTQGIVDRLMGTGTITILSSDKSHPKLVLQGIDQVQDVSELIDNTRRKERRQRGLHIEAI